MSEDGMSRDGRSIAMLIIARVENEVIVEFCPDLFAAIVQSHDELTFDRCDRFLEHQEKMVVHGPCAPVPNARLVVIQSGHNALPACSKRGMPCNHFEPLGLLPGYERDFHPAQNRFWISAR